MQEDGSKGKCFLNNVVANLPMAHWQPCINHFTTVYTFYYKCPKFNTILASYWPKVYHVIVKRFYCLASNAFEPETSVLREGDINNKVNS